MICILSQIKAVIGTGREPSDHNHDRMESRKSDDESDVRLFRCPSCETVYIATEKDFCSSCEMEVELFSDLE